MMTRLTNNQQNQQQSLSNKAADMIQNSKKAVNHPKRHYQSIEDSGFPTMNYFGTGSIKSDW